MKQIIKPSALRYGDTIGIIAPSYAMKPEYAEKPVEKLQSLGFKVKFSKHLFSDTNGYAGSVEERSEDFNTMISDNSVKMLLFGGGEVCNEILPYIDYESIVRQPKIICSYSDSTTILNAVQFRTGLVTFYGASLRTFENISDNNLRSFEKRLMSKDLSYDKCSGWKVICPGECEGVLTGGYLVNYAALQGLDFFLLSDNESYILFIEDHEMFSPPAVVSKWFSNLEHRGVFKNVRGLIFGHYFGHYSVNEQPLIDDILYRIGRRYSIPVIRCDDFGHGAFNTIIPIGIRAKMSTQTMEFNFCESGVF